MLKKFLFSHKLISIEKKLIHESKNYLFSKFEKINTFEKYKTLTNEEKEIFINHLSNFKLNSEKFNEIKKQKKGIYFLIRIREDLMVEIKKKFLI